MTKNPSLLRITKIVRKAKKKIQKSDSNPRTYGLNAS